MAIPLSKAPDLFFDLQKWLEFISYFESRETALARISHPPILPSGFYWPMDLDRLQSNEKSKQKIEDLFRLGWALVSTFRSNLIKGQIVANGFEYSSDDSIHIPAEQWKTLWPNFAEDKAMGRLFELTDIQLSRNDDWKTRDAELLERCASFLRRRSAEGVSQRKRLEKEARDLLGEDLTTRVFTAAYRDIFNKRRGRPRIKK